MLTLYPSIDAIQGTTAPLCHAGTLCHRSLCADACRAWVGRRRHACSRVVHLSDDICVPLVAGPGWSAAGPQPSPAATAALDRQRRGVPLDIENPVQGLDFQMQFIPESAAAAVAAGGPTGGAYRGGTNGGARKELFSFCSPAASMCLVSGGARGGGFLASRPSNCTAWRRAAEPAALYGTAPVEAQPLRRKRRISHIHHCYSNILPCRAAAARRRCRHPNKLPARQRRRSGCRRRPLLGRRTDDARRAGEPLRRAFLRGTMCHGCCRLSRASGPLCTGSLGCLCANDAANPIGPNSVSRSSPTVFGHCRRRCLPWSTVPGT